MKIIVTRDEINRLIRHLTPEGVTVRLDSLSDGTAVLSLSKQALIRLSGKATIGDFQVDGQTIHAEISGLPRFALTVLNASQKFTEYGITISGERVRVDLSPILPPFITIDSLKISADKLTLTLSSRNN